VPSVAVPDVVMGTVTASSALLLRVAVNVIADPSSVTLALEELKLTVGALSASVIVIVTD
jgi:hypothetical protein